MSLAAAFFLATVAVQAAPADAAHAPDRGAELETAQISATIVRPAVVQEGVLVSSRSPDAPRSRRVIRDGYITYEFE
jgi:hypothetical protein